MDTLMQLIVSGVLRGAVYALIAASFWLIYSTTKTFHLAHSVTYAVAGYATYVGGALLGLPLWVSGLIAIVVAAAFGIVLEIVVYRPLRSRGVGLLGIFLASLGVATAGPNLLQLVFGPQGRPVEGFPSATYAVGNVTFTLLQLTQAIVCIIVLIALGIALAHSKLGRAISAVRTNPELARSVGVPASRIGLLVFGVGSAMVAITAFFETAHFVATPTMGLQPVIYGFIGMFIGGISSLKGAAVGGFVLGFLLVFSGLFLSQNLGVLLVFAALVLVVIVRPEGLLSGAKR